MIKTKKNELLKQLSDELAISGFELENYLNESFSKTNLCVLEADLIRKVSGGRHEKTNADGSTSTTFVKAGGVTY